MDGMESTLFIHEYSFKFKHNIKELNFDLPRGRVSSDGWMDGSMPFS